MSYLHVSQSTAEWIASLELSRWVLLGAILLMVVVLFLPPVSVVLMMAPITLLPLKTARFDLILVRAVMTIVMELGLTHSPVGLNLFVSKSIVPHIPLRNVIWAVMPFVAVMIFAVVVLCMLPGMATPLADVVMGR